MSGNWPKPSLIQTVLILDQNSPMKDLFLTVGQLPNVVQMEVKSSDLLFEDSIFGLSLAFNCLSFDGNEFSKFCSSLTA
jgi:hypothetical protein